MKRFPSIFLLAFILIASNNAFAQAPKISFTNINVIVKDAKAQGTEVTFAFINGHTSDKYILYKSDTLIVSAAYRLNAYNSRRSQLKDASMRLHIFYECTYRNKTKSTKVEKMFFLDDKLHFSEKETFNFNASKYANVQVMLSYDGTITE